MRSDLVEVAERIGFNGKVPFDFKVPVGTLDVPVAGSTPTVVFPVRIEGLTARLDRAAPRLGANAEVYDEWVRP